jgi:predicted nucleic-acid-binding protein
MARPTKYTPETVQKITQAIELGATYELACGYAGIHYDTFNEWQKNKAEFSDAVKAAEGRAAVKWLAKIEAAAAKSWQAAAWKLERRYPDKYGRTVQDHNVNVRREDIIQEIAAKYNISPADLMAALESGDE